eukprot:6478522-Amphidinium_carterae.2
MRASSSSGCEHEVDLVLSLCAYVTKPLLSVADMVDQGHTVTFSRQGSCATHDKTGAVLPRTRRNRVFEVDLQVLGPVQGEPRMHLNPLEHEVVSRQGVEHVVVSRPGVEHEVVSRPGEHEVVRQPGVEHEVVDDDVGAAWDEDATEDFEPVRVRPGPPQPSKAERIAHEALHLPYREWCEHCVAARGLRHVHTCVDHSGEAENHALICVSGLWVLGACRRGLWTTGAGDAGATFEMGGSHDGGQEGWH